MRISLPAFVAIPLLTCVLACPVPARAEGAAVADVSASYVWQPVGACRLALGAGSGGGDAPYTVYVCGKAWSRISGYPCGMFDMPHCLAASWDTFGLLYIGFGGNSFVWGRPATAPATRSASRSAE